MGADRRDQDARGAVQHDAFLPSFSGGLWENLGDLFAYEDGQFWRWALNSVLYAGVGAALSALVSAMAGYGLAKYHFRGRKRSST